MTIIKRVVVLLSMDCVSRFIARPNASLGMYPSELADKSGRMRLRKYISMAPICFTWTEPQIRFEQARYLVQGAGRDVHPPWFARLFQPLRNVHCISPNVVGEAALPHDPRYHRTGVDPDTEFPRRQAQSLALPIGDANETLHLQRRKTRIDGVSTILIR